MAAFNYLNRLSHHYDPTMAVSMPQLTIPIPSAPATIANSSAASLSTWVSLAENSSIQPENPNLVHPPNNQTPNTHPNACSHCPKTFKRKSELERHERIHTGEKPYACNFCSKAFASRGSLTQHEKRHPELNSWPPNSGSSSYQGTGGAGRGQNNKFPCSQCAACTANGGRKILKCPHVPGGGGSGNTGNMDSYMLKNRCEFCGKGFRKKTVLTEHLKIHTGEKPFVCSQPDCGKRFAHRHHLTQHENIHTGKKPFRCHECEESYSHSYSLARHRRTHRRFQIPNGLQ